MPRPGVDIRSRETQPARGLPTQTDVAFMATMAERGSTSVPVLIQNMGDFTRRFGSRVTYSLGYDSAELFFREGGSRMYVSRVVGPAPAVATRILLSTATNSMRVDAANPGEWGNSLLVAVTAGVAAGSFVLTISHSTLGVLEVSPEFADKPSAVAWALNSDYVRAVDLGTGTNPTPAVATALAGGVSDYVNATDTHWLAALSRFSKDLGPGQVFAPGRTTATAHDQLLVHAGANNRVAICDAVNTATRGTLTALAISDRTANAKSGGLFAPWVRIPGLVPGTIRDVPPSGLVAGLMARNDSRGGGPNSPAAGRNVPSVFATDVTAVFTDDDRQILNEGGVNIIRSIRGSVQLYGYRSLVSPLTDPNNIQLNNRRFIMLLTALAEEIADGYVFSQIDGQGITLAGLQGALTGMLMQFYPRDLFGRTFRDAALVDVGPSVNTPETIARGEIHAVVSVRINPFAEYVVIELVKTGITEGLAA